MTISKIETGENNPVLRQKAKEVKKINSPVKELVFDMIETLEAKKGLGLAAPQVGQLLRIIVAKPETEEKAIALINPKIKKRSFRKNIVQEGCLSLPETYLPVKRPVKITVQGLDINGQKIIIKAEGLLARIIQHEVDHLDGIMIIDKKYE